MKHNIILSLLWVFATLQMWGVRAYPFPKRIVQPDGSTITIIGHGDEFLHYTTTIDGYSVVKGADGIFRYAELKDGHINATQIKARDINDRTESEKHFLNSIKRNIRPLITDTGERLRRLSSKNDTPLFGPKKSVMAANGADKQGTQEPYRGLVIMVNFNDRKFSRGDKSWLLTSDMMNKPDYTDYYDPLFDVRIQCTGSVRDYFSDNSNGRFIPEFDVIGPIDIDKSQFFINGTEKTYELCQNVIEAADPHVDYSRYDSDGDGVVDMFYILYAGYSSSYQGNDERLIWPHAGDFEDSGKKLNLDGVSFGRFACSSEIFGWHDDGDMYLDGIGVFVHEFSHVLGFKDHYDVSGYLNEDPGTWDVMASGNYNGILNDTPCGYSSYEKYAAGFITPYTATCKDDNERLSLSPLSASDDAVRIESTQDSTIFMLENRQWEKWDKYLPGHGMLVWRVDSCDNEYWEHNALNVNGRLHLKLVRAMGATRTLFREIEDTDYDPFPGTRNVYDLTNYSIESNLLTDWNYPSPLMLRNIKEEDGIISFTLEKDYEASNRPYSFCLREQYTASGFFVDETKCDWTLRTSTVQSNGRDRQMIYNLVPDTKNISLSDPKYAKGLGAAYAISGDKKSVIIEPSRVALFEGYGVWLVDFTALDNGGSGAIVLNMNAYGDLSLSNQESVLGYCLLPMNSAVVVADKIIERFSLVRDVRFDTLSGIDVVRMTQTPFLKNRAIFNMQGIRVDEPQKGEIYIIDGKKVKY